MGSGDHQGDGGRTQEAAHALSEQSPLGTQGQGSLAMLARTLNCLKPVEQESQGINTLAALNHPHLRNEHRAWCLGETKMTGAEA